MIHAQHSRRSLFEHMSVNLALAELGMLLPVLINYGHLLLSGSDYHWAPVVVSLGAALAAAVLLYDRGEKRGARGVAALYFPLNLWPIVATALSGAR